MRCNTRESGFTATTLILNLKNLSEKVWPFILAWELIDNDGFAYPAFNLCNQIDLHSVAIARKYRALNTKHWNISPDTQINAILLFPELDKGKKVSRISNCNYDIINSIQIEEMNESVSLEFEQKKRKRQLELIAEDRDVRNIRNDIDLLAGDIHSRITNLYDIKEIRHVDNRINNSIFRIEQKMNWLSTEKQQYLKPFFEEVIDRYRNNISVVKEREKALVSMEQRVKSLFSLTPIEFEEYVAELFKAIGYENISLTPPSNDKGIDIIMEKDGTRYAVQCKRYKKMIGSPIIQTFIGSMKIAEKTHGFIVATTTFTIEAEKMARENSIELIDNIKLGLLIQEALGLI